MLCAHPVPTCADARDTFVFSLFFLSWTRGNRRCTLSTSLNSVEPPGLSSDIVCRTDSDCELLCSVLFEVRFVKCSRVIGLGIQETIAVTEAVWLVFFDQNIILSLNKLPH